MSSSKERIFQKFQEIAARNPVFVMHNEPQFSAEDFQKIGITFLGSQITTGYIKLYPEDFLVEEITARGQICTIGTEYDQIKVNLAKEGEPFYIQATVVKKNQSTLDTQEILAGALNLPLNSINFAGIKDSLAITSQRFSFATKDLEKIENLNLEDIFLKDLHKTKGRVFVGQLLGNRFTILVRTQESVDKTALDNIVEEIKNKGFPNFYNLQRFGPRLLAHEVGKKIILRDFEAALKLFVTKTSPYEIPYINMLRTKMMDTWKNWNKLLEIMDEIPDYFAHEIALVKTLRGGGNYVEAFSENQRLTSIYYSAYVSYLFNQILSQKLNQGTAEKTLPLLSNVPEVLNLYKPLLQKDGLNLNYIAVPELPFIDNLIKPRNFSTKVIPGDIKQEIQEHGVVFSFILPKASYATSLLSYIFDLLEGQPKPTWVNDKLYSNLKETLRELAEKYNFSIGEEEE